MPRGNNQEKEKKGLAWSQSRLLAQAPIKSIMLSIIKSISASISAFNSTNVSSDVFGRHHLSFFDFDCF